MALPIFEMFLLDGERALFNIIVNMVRLQQKTILNQTGKMGENLKNYLKFNMPEEALKEYSMRELLKGSYFPTPNKN